MSETPDETQEPVEPVEPTPEEQEEGEQVETQEPAEGDETGPQTIPGGPPESSEVPPEPQGMSEKELEKAMKAIEKLREHVANRLGAIMGEDSQLLEPCPICGDSYPGHIFPPSAAPPDEQTVTAVKHYIGMPTEEEFRSHPDFQKCEECNGMSEVLTGSQRPGMWTAICPGCNGLGYKTTATQRVLEETNGTSAPAPIVTGPTVSQQPLPPEAQRLKELGYLVVAPVPTAQVVE